MLDRPDPQAGAVGGLLLRGWQEPIPESDEAASRSPECKTRLAESFNNSPKAQMSFD